MKKSGIASSTAYSPVVTLLDTAIDNLTLEETADRIGAMLDEGGYRYVVTPNIDHLMRLRHDQVFRQAYENAALRVPDGVPLLWAANFLGTPLKGRVNGTDLFELLAKRAASRGDRLFLMGGNPGAADRAARVLTEHYPGLIIAGTHCPPFGFDRDESQNAAIQEMIRESGANLLFVGLGAPRQELWLERYGPGCGVHAAVGIGVSFSLVAGEIPRAPVWMQRTGLEWFWRLTREPGRLWKRYLIDDLPFFTCILRERFRR